MTGRPVPFAHAGPIDFCKRRGSSCEAEIGQKQPFRAGKASAKKSWANDVASCSHPARLTFFDKG
jgi:hypothetical protein